MRNIARISIFSIGIIILELMFGWWIRPFTPWDQVDRINVVRSRVLEFEISRLYESSSATAKYTRDAYGLRSSCKTGSLFDVVTIGGSTTDQRYISDDKTWQEVLRREVLRRTKINKFCIANAGVDGHSSIGNLFAVEKWLPLIPDFNPKIYILYMGINDAGWRDSPWNGVDEVDETSWRSKSAFFQLARNLKAVLMNKLAVTRNTYAKHSKIDFNSVSYSEESPHANYVAVRDKNTQEFEGNLNEILGIIHTRGAKAICVSQPHRYAKEIDGRRYGVRNAFEYNGIKMNGLDYDYSIVAINQSMERLCRESGNKYLDLYSSEFQDSDFYDFVHMTTQGVEKVGERIADFLIDSKLIAK